MLEHPWSLLSYAFLHGDFLHIFFNMLALFMFGPLVEDRLGGARFARLYTLSALGGAALSLALLPLAGDAVIIGASAAVFGVMLAFVFEWPDAPIFVFPLPFPVKAKWLILFFAAVAFMHLTIQYFNSGILHFEVGNCCRAYDVWRTLTPVNVLGWAAVAAAVAAVASYAML